MSVTSKETDGAAQSKISSEKDLTWKGKLRLWYRKYVLHDIYPIQCKTAAQIFDVYIQRRPPPAYKASFLGMIGLSVANVISGEFAGWNTPLASSGYGGFWAASILAGLLYLSLGLCLAELSSSIPVVGGSFAYSRAILGNWGGFFTGNSENLMYCMFLTLLNVTFANFVREIVYLDKSMDFIWWFLLAVPVTILVCYYNKSCWKMMEYALYIYAAIIIGSGIFGVLFFDIKWLYANTDQAAEKTNLTTLLFPLGFTGVLSALPTTCWWYLGLESASLFSKETVRSQFVPKSLMSSWLYLSMCLTAVSIFGVLPPPGPVKLSESLFPMPAVISENVGKHLYKPLLLLVLPSLVMNYIGTLMSASRQTWALSRSGYLPEFLSIPISGSFVPARCAVFCMLYSIAMCVLKILLHNLDHSVDIDEALICIIVVSGCVAYIGIALTYIVFRYKYPAVPRPYKSPLGIPGAVLLIILSSTIVLIEIGVNMVFQLTVLLYVIKMSISGVYFLSIGRFHLKPTEESLITSIWAKQYSSVNIDLVSGQTVIVNQSSKFVP
jgi:ethanolamine permease